MKKKMKQDNNTIYSISAHIDLLGFSSHLVLSSYDLRTKIGEEAINRLRIIEEATEFLENELTDCKDFYPETFRFLRFNDSLILGIDLIPPIIPSIGKPNEGAYFSLKEIELFFGKNSDNNDLTKKKKSHFDNEAFKVSQFVGIVSRVHNFINQREFEIHMPGCRTIISSGLRYKFIRNKDKKEDYYSANFSLSNAYLVNEFGTKQGFGGSKCYLENNVARICGYNRYAKSLLGFSKFIRNDTEHDPFDGSTSNPLNSNFSYTISKPISIDLFNKKYQFRELNTNAASNLQLFPRLLSLIDKKFDEKNELTKIYVDCLKSDTPDLEKINNKEGCEIFQDPHFTYPVLIVSIRLQEKITELFKQFEK
jgi:hypothetical protein